VQPDAVELPGSAYVWFDVMNVTEPKQKPFEEVKDEVKASYGEGRRYAPHEGCATTWRLPALGAALRPAPAAQTWPLPWPPAPATLPAAA
jgi:hypothetical protein